MELSGKKFVFVLISFALVTGVIHSLPMIYVWCRLGSEYKGIFPLQSADEEHYDVSIKAAMDGHYYHKNNYLFEGRATRKGGIPPFSSEKILGFIGGRLGLNLSTWISAMRFIFPALAFLLMFALFRSLEIPRYHAIFWTSFNLLSPYLLFGWFDIFSRPFFRVLRDWGLNALWYEQYSLATLPWARMVNPQFSGLFFLMALICLVKIVKAGKSWFWFPPFVILAYVNYRLYFYFWSSLGALMLFMIIFSIFYRNYRILVPISLVLLPGLLYGFPRILSLIKTPGTGIESRQFILSPGCLSAVIILLLGIRFLRSWNLSSENGILFFVMPASVLLCMNQNVITGKIAQPWHYELFIIPLLLSLPISMILYRRDILNRFCEYLRKKLFQNHRLSLILSLGFFILLFMGGVILFFYYFKLSPNYKDAMLYIMVGAGGLLALVIYFRIYLYFVAFSAFPAKRLVYFLSLGLFLVVLFSGLTRQAHISIRVERNARENQYLAAPFQWLRENARPDSVVLASFEVSERIPLYTHNAVYLCKNALHEWNPSRESFRQRALNYFILTGYDSSSFRSILAKWPYGYLFWGLKKIVPERDLYSFTDDNKVPDDVLTKALSDFEERRKTDILEIMKGYRLDYMFYGPEEKKIFISSPEKLPYLYKVYEDSTQIAIYKFNQSIR